MSQKERDEIMILINIRKNKIIYNTLLKEWLLDRKETIKESSYVKYETIINNLIKPQLGEYDIKKLTEKVIYEFASSDDVSEELASISNGAYQLEFLREVYADVELR